ncbi:MAG: ATP-binding cassette domain-containing protein, partial [Betaproteobacteria bacterium]|nr:ATP-binding cassette domain-containing protein [Betaproteobacteria bacterium]
MARIFGYGGGGADVNISAEKVNEEARALSQNFNFAALQKLAGGDFLTMSGVRAGYGKIEILHGFDLCLERGKALCLAGPNGAGKSTVLHAVYGLAEVFAGEIKLAGRNIGNLPPEQKAAAGASYILQDNSIFPDMTVDENLLMGGYVLPTQDAAREAAERIFAKYDRLAARRGQKAGALSGGERRL